MSIPRKYRVFVLPSLVLVVIVLLSATFGKIMVDDFLKKRDEIEVLTKKVAILSSKRDLLSSLNKDILARQAQVGLSAVPSENSTLLALASIRTLASLSGVSVEDFKVRESETKGASEVGFDFSFKGPFDGILFFLKRLRSLAPLTKITGIEITASGFGANLEVGLISVWSVLAEELPLVDTPVDNLSSAESELLKTLESLTSSRGASGVTPLSPEGRANPFTL